MDTIASAAPVASAPAVAPIDRSDRDYVLLNLGRKFDAQLEEIARLDQVRDAQWRAFEAQRECYPLACRPRPGDVDLFGATFGEGERYDGAYSDRQVEEIRGLTEAYASSGPPFRRQVLIRRGDEITQAHARWMAANDRLSRQTGYRQDDLGELERAYEASTRTMREIMDVPAQTLAGLKVKARAALLELNYLSEADLETCETLDSDVMLWRIARDLLAMPEQSNRPEGRKRG